MADSFNFELVSPERLLVSEAAVEVVLPGTEDLADAKDEMEKTRIAEYLSHLTTLQAAV